ncbi:pupal cuticle protein 27 [Orussus abietinus]|uniref:pupal cuticle protein 27 n=1 Tax=Orussus abietinus TaxID=222816 RepID=UPI0006268513|nr:pupal cuticle protein 27 [Orussus abietinus]
MYTLVTVLLVAVAAVSAQYQQPGGNYVDDIPQYEAGRPGHLAPRSYATSDSPAAQRQTAAASPKPTPVAILKQINRHNEDGSYTYGFEGADGSFKIETKLGTGEVKGKYGFVDDTGKVRVVEYGANQYGFQPAGEGITVAPPTLVDETTSKEALEAQNYQDYQDYQSRSSPARAPARAAPAPVTRPRPVYQGQFEQPQSHTQAIYAQEQLQRAQVQSLPKPAIFAPAGGPAPQSRAPAYPSGPGPYGASRPPLRQSQLIQPAAYDEPAPVSQQYNQGPVQFSPAPEQAPRSQPQARSHSSGGILDQLARDYALPQGGAAPLHDISFGYY